MAQVGGGSRHAARELQGKASVNPQKWTTNSGVEERSDLLGSC